MKNFTQIPNEIIRSPELDPIDFRVYCAIMSCNPSHPAYETLAEWTGVARRRLSKTLTKLEELGLITVIRSVGRNNQYQGTTCPTTRAPQTLDQGTTCPTTRAPRAPEKYQSKNTKEKYAEEKESLILRGEENRERVSELASTVLKRLRGSH